MPSSSGAAVWVVVVALALGLGGCVFDQRRAMNEARAAYDACVAQHPHDAARECVEERAEVDATSQRYEDDAQRVTYCFRRCVARNR